jgi:hypothetical protein
MNRKDSEPCLHEKTSGPHNLAIQLCVEQLRSFPSTQLSVLILFDIALWSCRPEDK